MAIDFDNYLTDEQKKIILEQRIQQFMVDAYQHTMNKKVGLETDNEEAVAIAEANLETLETAIEIHQAEIKKLN